MGLAYFQADGGEKDDLEENVFKEPQSLDMFFFSKLGPGWYYCSGIPKNIYDEHKGNIHHAPNHYIQKRGQNQPMLLGLTPVNDGFI